MGKRTNILLIALAAFVQYVSSECGKSKICVAKCGEENDGVMNVLIYELSELDDDTVIEALSKPSNKTSQYTCNYGFSDIKTDWELFDLGDLVVNVDEIANATIQYKLDYQHYCLKNSGALNAVACKDTVNVLNKLMINFVAFVQGRIRFLVKYLIQYVGSEILAWIIVGGGVTLLLILCFWVLLGICSCLCMPRRKRKDCNIE